MDDRFPGPGPTATLTITGSAGDVSDGTQTVTATVSSTTINPNPANNTASASEASQPAPFLAVITPDPNNLNPMNVCTPSPVTQIWYGSVVNAVNPAAPSLTPGSFTYTWECDTTSALGCPTPDNDITNSSFISFDNAGFVAGGTYTFNLMITPESGANPNYQPQPAVQSISFTTTCIED